ncbi:MAG: M50 family metallopeptidase [Prevotella sp.]|nr:M50 family metallopeptidase [Prevotella sp.]
MYKLFHWLWIPLLVVLLLLMIRESVIIVQAIFFPSPPMTMLGNLEMYQWTGIGIVVYVLARGLLRKNLSWLEVFSHELTHTVVSMMLFRKIHSFRAGDQSGEVSTSGSSYNRVFVTLAPYCLPIFTYFFLLFRQLIKANGFWLYDIFIGVTIGFHAICFKTQTGNFQPDIRSFPLPFSYLYIFTALLFNINTILVSYWSSKNIFTALWYSVCNIWDGLVAFYGLIF